MAKLVHVNFHKKNCQLAHILKSHYFTSASHLGGSLIESRPITS